MSIASSFLHFGLQCAPALVLSLPCPSLLFSTPALLLRFTAVSQTFLLSSEQLVLTWFVYPCPVSPLTPYFHTQLFRADAPPLFQGPPPASAFTSQDAPSSLSQAVCSANRVFLLVSISVSSYLPPHFWRIFKPFFSDINHNHLPVSHLQKQLCLAPMLIPSHGPLIQPLWGIFSASTHNLIRIFMPVYSPCVVSMTFLFESEGHTCLQTHLLFPTKLLV